LLEKTDEQDPLDLLAQPLLEQLADLATMECLVELECLVLLDRQAAGDLLAHKDSLDSPASGGQVEQLVDRELQDIQVLWLAHLDQPDLSLLANLVLQDLQVHREWMTI